MSLFKESHYARYGNLRLLQVVITYLEPSTESEPPSLAAHLKSMLKTFREKPQALITLLEGKLNSAPYSLKNSISLAYELY